MRQGASGVETQASDINRPRTGAAPAPACFRRAWEQARTAKDRPARIAETADGRTFGSSAISSLVKVKLLPTTDIDLNTVITANDQESLNALQAGDVAFALAAIDNSRPPNSPDIRAIATLGRTGNLATTLLVRNDVDGALVQNILKTILDNVDFLSTVDQQAAGLTPDVALLGLAVPLHDGAKHF